MDLFIFVALLLVLLGLHVTLSILGSALEFVYKALNSPLGQARKSARTTSSFGSHAQDKEQELWVSSLGRLPNLDMFELNRLKFEQSLEHRLPEFHTSEFASTSVSELKEQSYTISIFDQIYVITHKQMEGLQLIQELLSEIGTSAASLNIRLCSSGLMPAPQTGMLGAVASIRNQIRLAASRSHTQGNYLAL